jgi:hypothetical protein
MSRIGLQGLRSGMNKNKTKTGLGKDFGLISSLPLKCRPHATRPSSNATAADDLRSVGLVPTFVRTTTASPAATSAAYRGPPPSFSPGHSSAPIRSALNSVLLGALAATVTEMRDTIKSLTAENGGLRNELQTAREELGELTRTVGKTTSACAQHNIIKLAEMVYPTADIKILDTKKKQTIPT